MFKTNILPAALKTQKDLARSIECYIDATDKKGPKSQVKYLSDMAKAIDEAIDGSIEFEAILHKAFSVKDLENKGKAFAHQVSEAQENFRAVVDHLETLCDDDHWTLPKIRELLFLV